MQGDKKCTGKLRRGGLLAAALTTAGLLASMPAQAQDKPVGTFGWFGVGKALELEKGHWYWVGEFSGSFFSDKGAGGLLHLAGVRCPAYFDADFNAGKSNAGGYCIIQDVDGDQAVASWKNAGTPGPGGRGPGTFTFTSATGKFKSLLGTTHNFVGITQINWADGTTSGYATWNK